MARYSDEREVVFSLQGINAETEKVARTQDDMLSRKPGDGPNMMETDLDMNSNRIYNLPLATNGTEPIPLGQLEAAIGSFATDGTTERVASVKDLANLDADVKYVSTLSFWPGLGYGGGTYFYESTRSKTEHNGGTIIDPNKISELGAIGEFGTYFAASENGTGCFILLISPNSSNFGAVCNGIVDDSFSLEAAAGAGVSQLYPYGVHLLKNPVVIDGTSLVGPGYIKKSSSITKGLSLKGVNPSIKDISFEPESSTGQPNTCIKLEDGCVNPSIQGNYFYSPRGSTSYSAITASEETTSDEFPYTTNVKKASIFNNTFIGYTRPLYLLCIDDYKITENRFSSCDFDAIRIRASITGGIISNNLFEDIGDPNWPDNQTRDAIDTASSGKDLIISNNIIKKCAYLGIDIKGDGSDRIQIIGNNIEDTRYDGIKVSGVGKFIITNNIIKRANLQNLLDVGGVSDSGIAAVDSISDVCIAHNQIYYCGGYGIFTEGTVLNAQIIGNICVNNTDTGIRHDSEAPGQVCLNICENRPLEENGNAQSRGLWLSADDNFGAIVFGNICKNNTSLQIAFNTTMSALHWYMGNYEEGPSAYGAGSGVERFNSEPKREFFGSGVPPSAVYGVPKIGDKIYLSNPVAGGALGQIYTSSGWKNFGTIEA